MIEGVSISKLSEYTRHSSVYVSSRCYTYELLSPQTGICLRTRDMLARCYITVLCLQLNKVFVLLQLELNAATMYFHARRL